MTEYISDVVNEQKHKAVMHVYYFGTETAYYSAKNRLTGYLRALVDLHYIDWTDKNATEAMFEDETLGFVKER